MNIYVASSWRNARQSAVVEALRAVGHVVYDFRNPAPGKSGFGWQQCDPRPPSQWSVADYQRVLEHPLAQEGFQFDMNALRACDACVLVLPCGRSAHLELGWACGARKLTLVLCERLDEPELMYLMNDGIVGSIDELVEALARSERSAPQHAIVIPELSEAAATAFKSSFANAYRASVLQAVRQLPATPPPAASAPRNPCCGNIGTHREGRTEFCSTCGAEAGHGR